MIKKLIAMRVEKLLDELDRIFNAHTDRVVDSQNELSPMKQAISASIQPKEIKRIISIKEQLMFLQGMFGDKE